MSVKSRTGRLVVLGAVLFTGMALVAGCGGDSDSDSGSKEGFIASADQLCADFREQAKTVETEFTDALDAGDLETAAQVFEGQGNAMSDAIDEIESLDVPSEDQATIDEFIALSRDQVDVTLEAADAIRNGDRQAFESAIADGEALEAQSDELADGYGLVDCGSAGDEDSSVG